MNPRHQWQSIIKSSSLKVDVCAKCGVYRMGESVYPRGWIDRFFAPCPVGDPFVENLKQLPERPVCVAVPVPFHYWTQDVRLPHLTCSRCGVERLESILLDDMVWTGFRTAGETEWRRVYLPCTKKGK